MREEGIVKSVLSVEHLACLQLERAEALRAGPSARHLDVHILVKQHLALGGHVAEVYGAVPVVVVVAGLVLPVAGLAVGTVAVAVKSDFRVGEELPVANDRDDGKRVLVAGLDVRAGDGHAGQHAVLEQTERVVGGAGDGEVAVLALAGR